ncbi:hypothetical protein NCAS_0A00360 [Naumovozyma castellii]|uniref:Glutaredoxin domain-containing protein n=1 Tax=Naumovozyma castellii TaxID=27288 RepID=G0V560_NAUCA|nr:hypothetical protein NCAS_0A00360 [Naumovozyma castellii CBS 4309]CCC66596.1 hypothetical protein NCAS_0A00360 [Naumovozyma castellii CBS 4309]
MHIPENLRLVLIIIFFTVLYYHRHKKENKMVAQETIDYVQKLIKENKIIVFAKSYCPYSIATRRTLFNDCKVPQSKALVLELDLMQDGQEIQQALLAINGQKTVPHVYIAGEFIGGNHELQQIFQSGELQKKLAPILA